MKDDIDIQNAGVAQLVRAGDLYSLSVESSSLSICTKIRTSNTTG